MAVSIRRGAAQALTAITIFTTSVPGHSQELPEGAGRDVMFAACTACHGLNNILAPHKPFTAEEWEFYLYDMVSRGAPVPGEDLDVLRRYLVENFASDSRTR